MVSRIALANPPRVIWCANVLIAFVAVSSASPGNGAETLAVAQLAVPAVVDTAIALAATRECFVCSREPNKVRGAHEPLRGSGRMLAIYARLALEDEIKGFLNVPSYAAFAVVYAAQRAAGVWGAVGEIGAHHGRSFILAALLSSPSEPLWVLDLFEELQALNVDESGSGSFAALSRNMARVGLDIAAASVERRSSADLPADYFCSGAMPRFRFFSVDGGHTEELTRLDMTTARCHLAEGGVIAVDDIFNNLFLGVTEGVFNFMALNRDRLAPFLAIAGKMYFTTPSHHERYLAAAAAFFIPRYPAAFLEDASAEAKQFWGWRVVALGVKQHREIESNKRFLGQVLDDFKVALGDDISGPLEE